MTDINQPFSLSKTRRFAQADKEQTEYHRQLEIILDQLKRAVDGLQGDTMTITAYDQLAVESEEAEVQVSARYDNFHGMTNIDFGTGVSSVTGGEYVAFSGTGSGSSCSIFTQRQVISRPGQGTIVRLLTRYGPPQLNSQQICGIAHGGDGAFFGFVDTTFGILHNRNGTVQIQTMTVTTSASGSETADVVINGTTYPISITGSNEVETAASIAIQMEAAVALWNFTQNGDDVNSRSIFPGASTGAFSYTATGGGAAVVTFAQVELGSTPDRNFTPQIEWTGDQVPALDPSKLNLYTLQYNGDLEFFIDVAGKGRTLVHSIGNPNTSEVSIFGVESFRLLWAASNPGGSPATGTTVFGQDGGGFIQGKMMNTEPAFSSSNGELSVGETLTNILTIRCRDIFGGRANLGRLIPTFVSASTDGNKGANVVIIINAVFADPTNFSYINQSDSIAEVDTTASEVSGGSQIASFNISDSLAQDLTPFHQSVLPLSTITIAMQVPSGASADMNASLVWEEEV